MAWRRGYLGFSVLLLLTAGACDGGQSLAPTLLVVSPPGSLTATAVAFNQIALSWQDNSRNESGFEVWRSSNGPSGSFDLIASLDPLTTAYNDVGPHLTGLTQYCYEVRAFRITGKKTTPSEFSGVACATTPAVPVPAAPSGVAASPNQGFSIRVVWTDNSTDEANFRIERAPGATGPWSTVATFPANSTNLTDFSVAQEQLACYRVFATNAFGPSDPSNVACTAIPAAPIDLAPSVAGTAVDLTWTDNSRFEDGFDVLRSAGTSPSVIAHVSQDVTSYHDADVVPDNIYTYFVRATRDGGTGGASNNVQVIVATSAPQGPAVLSASPSGSTAVVLFWNDLSNNEQGFTVERSTAGGAWIPIGSTGMNETFLADNSVVPEQEVCYRVIAFNNAGVSSPSNEACTTTLAPPTDFTATASPGDDFTVDFTWTDNSAIEDGYQLWIDDGYYGGQYPVADVPAGPGSGTSLSFQLSGYYAYGYWFGVAAVKNGVYSDFVWTYAVPPAGVARVRGSPPKAFHPPRQRKLSGR